MQEPKKVADPTDAVAELEALRSAKERELRAAGAAQPAEPQPRAPHRPAAPLQPLGRPNGAAAPALRACPFQPGSARRL